VQPALLGQSPGEGVGFGKVEAVNHQVRSEGPHGPVLLRAVALRHADHRRDPQAARGESDALAVIAAGGGYHLADIRPGPPEIVQVDEATAHLEGAGGGVVLVLDPDLAPAALTEQGPWDLRRGGYRPVDQARRGLELG